MLKTSSEQDNLDTDILKAKMVSRIVSSSIYRLALNNGMPLNAGKSLTEFTESCYMLAAIICNEIELGYGTEFLEELYLGVWKIERHLFQLDCGRAKNFRP